MRRVVTVPILGLGAACASWVIAGQSGVEAARRVGAVAVCVAAILVFRAVGGARSGDTPGTPEQPRAVDRFARYEALVAKIGWAIGDRGDARSILGPVLRGVALDVQSGGPGERLARAHAALGEPVWAQFCETSRGGAPPVDLVDLEAAVTRLERLEAEWR